GVAGGDHDLLGQVRGLGADGELPCPEDERGDGGEGLLVVDAACVGQVLCDRAGQFAGAYGLLVAVDELVGPLAHGALEGLGGNAQTAGVADCDLLRCPVHSGVQVDAHDGAQHVHSDELPGRGRGVEGGHGGVAGRCGGGHQKGSFQRGGGSVPECGAPLAGPGRVSVGGGGV